jgi:hypothetical protein
MTQQDFLAAVNEDLRPRVPQAETCPGRGSTATSAFKVGVRVRLARGHRHPDYQVGDPAIVEQMELLGGVTGLLLYHFRMDRDGRTQTFYGAELELMQ